MLFIKLALSPLIKVSWPGEQKKPLFSHDRESVIRSVNGRGAHEILGTGVGLRLVNIIIEYLPMHVAAKVTLNSEYCYCEL